MESGSTAGVLKPSAKGPIVRNGTAQGWRAVLARRRDAIIAGIAVTAILLHLGLLFGAGLSPAISNIPLAVALILGGTPLVWGLAGNLLRREFGSDLLAGISIVTSALLGEYLAGTIVVLMLSGGEALEAYALRSASSVLEALAKRMPSVAHRRKNGNLEDVTLDEVEVGDTLLVYPHDICPVDGEVVEGRGVMDESYLTGEPFRLPKTVGSTVMSGAINGEAVLAIRATRRAQDSRYAKIMEVMRESETRRPKMRRLGDQLGAVYTPLALAIALLAWGWSGDVVRFLSVLVIATPCPLLIAIPVAIIGSISLCAKRAIVIKSPVVLEQIEGCRTAIFDKTGTLTYGEPKLTEQFLPPGIQLQELLGQVASLERFSKHPLGTAVMAAARELHVVLPEATEVNEAPGQGLTGRVSGKTVRICSAKQFLASGESGREHMPPTSGGLECVVSIQGQYAGTLRFRDAPRAESSNFVAHLRPKHHFRRLMILSGDRESEVRYLAEQVGITEVHAQKTPEEKLAIVREETARAKTLYVGDGINDAPAMMAATVGMAIGQNSDVTTEAAGVVIMDNSLRKVDEFMHISRRMRAIALQSAVGGMALSLGGMILAATGHLGPVSGAISQEVIDVLAVLNALRAAFPPKVLADL